MIYKENSQEFSMETFKNPPIEYRDVPFWAWNTKMTKEDIDFCLSVFKEMGMGGAFLHSRTGMDTPYLSEEFMELISYAHEKAGELGLKAWLYDEDRWPSGFGGGLVTKREEYRSRFLVWSPRPYIEGELPEESKKGSTAQAVRSRSRKLLGVYQVESQDGFLSAYRRLSENETNFPSKEEEFQDLDSGEDWTTWCAYLEVGGDNPWFNNQSYVDTLNPEAVKAFLDSTYERYKDKLGKDFGTLIPAIFTDEPQFTPKQRASGIDARKEVILPFTDKLPELFQEAYGLDLLDYLPELFYDKEQEYSYIRYCYHQLVSSLFAKSYAMQIGKWCETSKIALTGHLMEEPLLSSQTRYVGEAMLSYAGFQIPGIDILCDRREFTTAKQAQSAVHQFDREAMASELYGVTNWDYDFRGHKLQGDWQAALGVTLRAPHLAWTSMEGEAKRDYPASIFYQSPWYQEYRMIEDYFARIASVMSRGKALVKIGVIHPIETCWLLWGTEEKTGKAVEELDGQFVELTNWLLGNCLDFDFISEALIPELYKGTDGKTISIGAMNYEVLLVPFMETMRKSTLDMLCQWKAAGGKIIFIGNIPRYVDGKKSDEALKLSVSCVFAEYSKNQIRRLLENYSQLELFYGEYVQAEDLLCQVREEGLKRYVFLAHKENPRSKSQVIKKDLIIRVKGLWNGRLLNPMDGTEKTILVSRQKESSTEFMLKLYDHDSVLMILEKVNQEFCAVSVPESCPVTLTEPNVLVLDMPEYSFDGQPGQIGEEILRLDNHFRNLLGYPLRTEAWPQPWTRAEEGRGKDCHQVELCYRITSEIENCQADLALEQLDETCVFWNGEKTEVVKKGWYVDRRIEVISLGRLKKGENELRLVRTFHEKTNLEAVYLLGDFGVKVSGQRAVIIEPVRELRFGDWGKQGLPFYGGDVIYHLKVEGRKEPVKIEVRDFKAPLIRVDIEGRKQGIIAFSPYQLTTEVLRKGVNQVDLTAYGTRVNTFGALHNSDSADNKSAPDYWRTNGKRWSYEYCFRPAGILKAPIIWFQEKKIFELVEETPAYDV